MLQGSQSTRRHLLTQGSEAGLRNRSLEYIVINEPAPGAIHDNDVDSNLMTPRWIFLSTHRYTDGECNVGVTTKTRRDLHRLLSCAPNSCDHLVKPEAAITLGETKP